ncbi:hypothetical protein Tco_0726398 [Tanacetum coccineum]|uniref:Uncharacterized protein n=1 Tax=Tanacetum coccineum TaxID=301880 RepID=A0ABQ4YGD3_9ASTR
MSDSSIPLSRSTSISSEDGKSLDVRSPGVIVLGYDGLPMMPEDPYAYVEAAMQEPPPSDFVPEPVYPKFMPPEDDVLPAEEQPLHAAVSPIACFHRRRRVPPGRRSEEEEEHLAPADSVPSPAYRTTNRMSIRAQTPIPFPSEVEVDRLLSISTPSSSLLTSLSSPLPQIPSPPLPVSSPLPISPSPLPASPTHPLGYRAAMIRLRAESPFTSHLLPLPPAIVLLRTRAFMVIMRAAAPSTYILAPRSEIPPSRTPPSRTPLLLPIPLPTSSPPLLLPSTECRADVPKVTLLPRKRLCIALSPRYEIGECSSAHTARPTGGFRVNYGFVGTLDAEIRRESDREIGYGITDVWVDPDEIAEERTATDVAELGQRMTDFLNLLRRDRRSHARTARLMESEARASRGAWVQSMDASDTARYEVRALRTTVLEQTEIGDLRAADRRRQSQLVEALTLLRTLQTQMVALQSL